MARIQELDFVGIPRGTPSAHAASTATFSACAPMSTRSTGVCHMAIFADPDGNQLMLHRRYAPYGNA